MFTHLDLSWLSRTLIFCRCNPQRQHVPAALWSWCFLSSWTCRSRGIGTNFWQVQKTITEDGRSFLAGKQSKHPSHGVQSDFLGCQWMPLCATSQHPAHFNTVCICLHYIILYISLQSTSQSRSRCQVTGQKLSRRLCQFWGHKLGLHMIAPHCCLKLEHIWAWKLFVQRLNMDLICLMI